MRMRFVLELFNSILNFVYDIATIEKYGKQNAAIIYTTFYSTKTILTSVHNLMCTQQL